MKAPPPSNPRSALPDWHTHPAVTVGESVGPFWASWSSAPPRLDLTGQRKHFSVKEQKQQRMDRGGRSNDDSN
ncbi:hypothetical protein NQZ68_028092 [Dissostichus eleginoides]|nr:hypothetical protein NQZ68_028092 [Dissostichus eleginoides]